MMSPEIDILQVYIVDILSKIFSSCKIQSLEITNHCIYFMGNFLKLCKICHIYMAIHRLMRKFHLLK